MYVRLLHRNLNFSKANMRKAIGTSIRSAKCELRRVARTREQLYILQKDQNLDPDDNDDNTNATPDTKAMLDVTNDNTDDDEDEGRDEGEDEDVDKLYSLMIDEALDEDDD